VSSAKPLRIHLGNVLIAVLPLAKVVTPDWKSCLGVVFTFFNAKMHLTWRYVFLILCHCIWKCGACSLDWDPLQSFHIRDKYMYTVKACVTSRMGNIHMLLYIWEMKTNHLREKIRTWKWAIFLRDNNQNLNNGVSSQLRHRIL
jgi:hypothetical protein